MQRYKRIALEILHYLKEEEAKRTDPVKDPVLPTSNRVYQELLDKLAPREGIRRQIHARGHRLQLYAARSKRPHPERQRHITHMERLRSAGRLDARIHNIGKRHYAK